MLVRYCLYGMFLIVCGAADISLAIKTFRKGEYFKFGFWAILALMTLAPLLKYTFNYRFV